MDRITRSQVAEFVAENSMDALPEDAAFEHFAGYLVTATHYSDTFASDEIHVGQGGDCGIDTIGIIVNGCLVSDAQEVDDLLETNRYLEVTLVFSQSTRSSNFDAQKMGGFGFGVADFVSEDPSLPRNDALEEKRAIWDRLLDLSTNFSKGNPDCYLYYVTTGRWMEDAALIARRDAAVRDLEALNLFGSVHYTCVDAERLQQFYRDSRNAIQTTITFETRVVLPEFEDVEQAFLGLLPAPQFLRLVENDNEEILASVFFDNVRHWQEWNRVNNAMRETLEDPSMRDYFPLLNNGVTIVARRITSTGNRYLVEDYQVVNGCQTSFVLHELRDMLGDSVQVPVRLIETEDVRVRNAIIKATNTQTPVSDEHLVALLDFPRRLEAFFPTYDDRKKLYYERRARQYGGTEGIEKVRVITMRDLVRAFASMFLGLPHRTTRNYKTLLSQIGKSIFGAGHRLEPYYVAAYAHYRLEYLFRSQALRPDLKPARYHLLMAYRYLAGEATLPSQLNGSEVERLSNRLMATLWDDDEFRVLFEAAAAIVREVAQGDMHRDNIRTEPFTVRLLASLQAGSSQLPALEVST